MLEKIYKKITKISLGFSRFFKEHLAQIVFLVFAFQILSFIGALPYFNLIAKYQFYIASLLWILANFLFRQYINTKIILKLALLVFILDVPIIILDFESLSSVSGFVAFVLLFTYVCRKIFVERNELKNIG